MKHQARNEKKIWYNSVHPVYFDYRTGKKKFHPHQINDFIVGSIAKCFMVSSPVDRAPRRFHNKRRRRKKKVVDATEFLLFSSSTDGDGDLFMHLRNEGKKKKEAETVTILFSPNGGVWSLARSLDSTITRKD